MLTHILKIECVSNLSRWYQIASHVVKLTYLIKFLLAFYSTRVYWTPAKCQKLFLITGSIVVNIMHRYAFKKIFIYWIGLGLHCCALAFSSCGKRGLLCNCDAWVSPCGGFSCCGASALACMDFRSYDSWAQQLWSTGLAALWHVESSRTRDQTCVPCICRWILNHWTTREVPMHTYF